MDGCKNDEWMEQSMDMWTGRRMGGRQNGWMIRWKNEGEWNGGEMERSAYRRMDAGMHESDRRNAMLAQNERILAELSKRRHAEPKEHGQGESGKEREKKEPNLD